MKWLNLTWCLLIIIGAPILHFRYQLISFFEMYILIAVMTVVLLISYTVIKNQPHKLHKYIGRY